MKTAIYIYYFYNIIFGKTGFHGMSNPILFTFLALQSCGKHWMLTKLRYYSVTFEVHLICVT